MTDANEKFQKYQREHARLHDPEVRQSSVELIPVDLGPLVPSVSATGKRDKKGRRKRGPANSDGATTVSAPADLSHRSFDDVYVAELNDPLKHESFMEYIRWLKSLHASQTKLKPEKEVAPKPWIEPETEPDIAVTPVTLQYQADLFQPQSFEINTIDGQKVELVWQADAKGELRRVAMDQSRHSIFQTTIGIEDGDYLFGYSVDGWMRPDARYAQRLSLRPDGIFAPLKLSRQLRRLRLHNRGKSEELVWLRSNVSWLSHTTELRLPAGQFVKTMIQMLPQKMIAGLNEGVLQVVAQRKGSELVVATVCVEASAEARGTIADFRYEPQEYGWILQGKQQLELNIEIEARGQGLLTGMVMLRYSEEVEDFRLDTDEGPRFFSHSFVIDSAHLPYRAEGTLKVTLVTDSYLANYRLRHIELPYRLIYLKKSLPALSFGHVRKGETPALRLDVRRSDGQKIDLEALVPASASRYLDAYRAGNDAYTFRLDTRELQSQTKVDDVITLFDRSSGLRDQIKILAEVGSYQRDGLATALTSS